MLDYQNNNFYDLINIISLVIGMQNIRENREQSSHNDIQAANDKQADYLIKDLSSRFAYQNMLLEKNVKMSELILQKLEELRVILSESN